MGSARRDRSPLEGQARRARRRDAAHRASTIEGQIARVADIIAYVNHDIDDAVRAGILSAEDLPRTRVELLGAEFVRADRHHGDRRRLQTFGGGLTEIRMSDDVLEATLDLRSFLFEAVYENESATAEFKKAAGILGGLWERSASSPPDSWRRTIDDEGLDAAARDFLAGMTDRYAVSLFEKLFIPKPWVSLERF